jgi:ADP-ribosylglycohydrolase
MATAEIVNKIRASVLLHALGDTMGFGNGMIEFNHQRLNVTSTYTLELLYEFIENGGITGIDLTGWKVSDDTLLNMAVIRSFLTNFKTIYELGNNLKKEFLKVNDQFDKELDIRIPGVTTRLSMDMLKKGTEWDKIPYGKDSGGSGASMRTPCIGLMYYGSDNLEKLLKYSIESSRITHNNAVGYLGGLTSALFTAYAMEKREPRTWAPRLIKLLKSGIIDKYIAETRDYDQYNEDKHDFISQWEHYITDKFDSDGKIIVRKSHRNLVYRGNYYASNFGRERMNSKYGHKGKISGFIGGGGDDSVIIAYDCLLDAENSWEKLVIYAMLHIGDTDTTGCIAGAWYGAYYGMDNVPNHLLNNLEYKNELNELATKIGDKFL